MSWGAWLLRGLLAALLAFTSEVILWTAPDTRPAFDWFVLIYSYLALSALLLDLAARYRLRDPFGLLALAGIYGLLNAALFNPATAFADFPRTLFTRAMGGHTLMGLLALALWLRLTGKSWNRAVLIVAAIFAAALGVVWGYWTHFSPPVFVGAVETPLINALIVYGGIAFVVLALSWALRRAPLTIPADAFRLKPSGWVFILLALAPVLGAQFSAGRLDGVQITTVVMFAAFCMGIIWYQKRQKGATLLDDRQTAVPVLVIGLILIVGVIGGLVGYAIPRGDLTQTDPLAVIGALLTAYGLVWLPLVTFVLGAREFTKQSRAMRL